MHLCFGLLPVQYTELTPQLWKFLLYRFRGANYLNICNYLWRHWRVNPSFWLIDWCSCFNPQLLVYVFFLQKRSRCCTFSHLQRFCGLHNFANILCTVSAVSNSFGFKPVKPAHCARWMFLLRAFHSVITAGFQSIFLSIYLTISMYLCIYLSSIYL